MEDLTLTIHGMSCGHCVQSITNILSALEGVKVDQVTIGKAALGYKPQRITPDRIVQAIEQAGYEARIRKEAV